MHRFCASDLADHDSNFAHLFIDRRLIVTIALFGIVQLSFKLQHAPVKMISELLVLEELLVLFKLLVQDAIVFVLVVLLFASSNDRLQLSEGLSIQYLLT